MPPLKSIINLLPKNLLEVFPFIFAVAIIPITYWFEIWTVLPSVYPPERFPITYIVLFILGHYLLFNVVGNYLGVILNDTSIRGRIMPPINSPAAATYCDICVSVTPARSYHCPTCKVCILRRDHHCLFTACCIGHYNYRYFLMFLLHMFMSVLLCLPYNIMFLWDIMTASNFLAVAQVFFPIIIVFTGFSFNAHQGYLLLCTITFGGMFFIGVWFYFHLRLAMNGQIVHELRRNKSLYDLGIEKNMEQVLGRRWRLVCFSPFISSELTCDGITFETKVHSS